MLVSLNWLKDFVKIPKDINSKELGEKLTLKTAEVETVINESENLNNIVVGRVTEIKPHPNADKLKIAMASLGKENVQIVCGGENLKEGMYVAVAKPGAYVKWHGEGEPVKLEQAKIRGEESFGMICAGNEIGISNTTEGPRDILDLSAKKPTPGTPLSKLLKKDDVLIEFDNKALTNRPDLWGHLGIAREIAAITGKKLKPLKISVKIPEQGEKINVEVKDKKLCPRFCALIINNIKVKASPEWMIKRLKATGHGTHNNIVDVTNYVMSELGQPMHAFDRSLVKAGIIVRMAEKNEKLITLDGKERTLTEEMGVVADYEKASSIAGIIGGATSEIKPTTTSIILEAANWHPAILRRASIKLGVRTDAVQRFEKSLDPHLPELAIKRAAELILKICPEAVIAGPMTDIKNFEEKVSTIELNLDKARSKIGVNIPTKDIKKILKSLEFGIEQKDKKTLLVTIPTFRANKDVTIEDDLIEEIARIYGYDSIPATLPNLPTKLPEENTERFKKHRARELLSYGLGFDEVTNYSFYSKTELEKCLLKEEGHLKILNYLSEDQTHLRMSLAPLLLKNLQLNSKNFDKIKIYEIGRTYREIGKFYPLEEKKITGAIMVKGKSENIFYEAKGIIETFIKKFNLPHINQTKGIKGTPYAHPSKSISYIDENAQTLAKVFILHPTVQKNYDLEKYSIAFFAINFTEILKLPEVTKTFKQIPKFPSIVIDISVVLDRTIEIETIRETIKKADSHIITNIELFDIYEGENIEKGKKSVAFNVTLMALDRTLTDQDMSEIQNKIFKNLETLGGKIRGR